MKSVRSEEKEKKKRKPQFVKSLTAFVTKGELAAVKSCTPREKGQQLSPALRSALNLRPRFPFSRREPPVLCVPLKAHFSRLILSFAVAHQS